MKKILLLSALFWVFAACKKSSTDETSLIVTIVTQGGISTTVPATVHFSTTSGDYDSATWDFGDGTTGTGLTTQHTYTHFGCFKVTVTAKKGSATAVNSKDVPVSNFKRIVLKNMDVITIPAFGPGGVNWDSGTDPDLTYSIVFPGDTMYNASTILWNVTGGSFNLPVKGTYDLSADIVFKIFDKDTENVPDLTAMGNATLNVCHFLNGPDPLVPVDSAIITNGPLSLKVKWTWVPL
jgi:hypothetical protein